MASFQDRYGQKWAVEITVGTIRRAKTMLGIDLYSLFDDNFAGLQKLSANPAQLADVLFVCCKTQADAEKVTDEQFGEALAGDSLEAAGEAFVDAFLDFFPNRRAKQTLRKMMVKSREVQSLAMDAAEKELESLSVEQLAATLKNRSGDVPVLSASTQAE